MSDQFIKRIGKTIFYLLWSVGTLCLLGYWMSEELAFAIAGFYLLIIGTVFSSVLIVSLLAYGMAERERYNACLSAIQYLLYNIPLAALYAVIGINII